ncbi:hypothetical protein BD289DRAFT_363974 [Coniella lustricola]|uniref:Uncharacterized protein n=1 Tax=Coniella lustricola TaxID=2025994 RepID=A0A2T3AEM7_9PEZI|nr:hypothetical protein BD289DRAFT_363974 [Coniella lustricola]
MKGRPVDALVYEHMFPKPRSQDPQNFHALLMRHLILEVRQEVHAFYGHLDTPEAKYPGLDYNNRTHRTRLSRWQWHRRLFRAFDALRLTPSEVSGLTKWEGTKWAKERYEREQDCAIRDTAMDGLPVWTGEPQPRRARTAAQDGHLADSGALAENEEEEEDSEGELESVGIALNARLQERMAARNAGDLSVPLDEAWEQWFKNAVETGEISAVRERQRMLDNARLGNWHEVPAPLRVMIRNMLVAEQRDMRRSLVAAARSSVPNPSDMSSAHVGILSAPLPSIPHGSHIPPSRSSRSGLRLPSAFETLDDGGTSHPRRTDV